MQDDKRLRQLKIIIRKVNEMDKRKVLLLLLAFILILPTGIGVQAQDEQKINTIYEVTIPPAVEVKDYLNLTETEIQSVRDSILNANPELPDNTTITVLGNGTAILTYSDGSEDVLYGTPPSRLERSFSPLVKGKPYSEQYEPIGKDIHVTINSNFYARQGIENKDEMPDRTTYNFNEMVDKSTPGTKDAVVIVKFRDESTVEVPIKVLIGHASMSEINYIERDFRIKQGTDLDDIDILSFAFENQGGFYAVTDTAFIEDVDTSTLGDKETSIRLTFSDGTTMEVSVTVTVVESHKEQVDFQFPEEIKLVNTDGFSSNDKNVYTSINKQIIERAINEHNPFIPQDSEINIADDGTITLNYPDGTSDSINIADRVLRTNIAEAVDSWIRGSYRSITYKDPIPGANRFIGVDFSEITLGPSPESSIGRAYATFPEENPPVNDVLGRHAIYPRITFRADNSTGSARASLEVNPGKMNVRHPFTKPNPRPTVYDINYLTDSEKEEVRQQVLDSNPNLPDGTTINIETHGDARAVYRDMSENHIRNTSLLGYIPFNEIYNPVAPDEKTKVNDINQLTEFEKGRLSTNILDKNPGLPNGTSVYGRSGGSVVIRYADFSKDVISSDQLVTQKTESEKYWARGQDFTVNIDETPDAEDGIDNKDALPDDVTYSFKDGVPDTAEPGTSEVTIVVTYSDNSTDEVTVTMTVEEPSSGDTIADEYEPSIPTKKVVVEDTTQLTDEEKATVKTAIEDANQDLPADTTIEVADDGTATLTYSDDSSDTISGEKLVTEADKADKNETDKTRLKESIDKGNEVKNSDEYRQADSENQKALDDALKNAEDVYNNPDATQAQIDNAKTVLDNAIDAILKESSSQDSTSDVTYHTIEEWMWHTYGVQSPKPLQEKEPVRTPEGFHNAYLKGYPDGTIRPNENMTRAEAATMISRLLELPLGDISETIYTDTPKQWYREYINAVSKTGIMSGYPDGTFKPDELITRAEFVKMLSNFDDENSGNPPFSDIQGHWAKDAIGQGVANERIKGYPDGTFKPESKITRAEAVTILNRAFDRSVDAEGLLEAENLETLNEFKDLAGNHWAFYELLEATHTHSYERKEENKVSENWIELESE